MAFIPASTLCLTVVYVAGAAVALILGSPAQRLLGVAVLALTVVRLALLRGAQRGTA